MEDIMKKIAATLVFLFSFTLLAMAADNPGQGQKDQGANFVQRKEMMLKRIDERIAHLQEVKSCIQASTKPEDMKACREKMKEERMEHGGMGGGK
jgi:hypothetical protein